MSNTRRPTGTAATAAKAEALNAEVTFEFDGETYTIEPADSWDLEALEEYEANRIAGCVRLVLGEAQWRKFRSKRRTIGDLNAMFEAAQNAAGIEGN
ncbi:hypothetical protein AB0H43_03020 [Hamadaea sp. NPDC050747]|uniref:hypothetical protein n=1 Tax=Hamadaea sp. NPDC050747 TaxID=3155789 RepID=UPI003406D03E